jgi:hypothetical protein
MSLMVVYVTLLFIGQAAAVVIAVLLDNISKALGLAVFLGLVLRRLCHLLEARSPPDRARRVPPRAPRPVAGRRLG